jgi:hypothetical protein
MGFEPRNSDPTETAVADEVKVAINNAIVAIPGVRVMASLG